MQRTKRRKKTEIKGKNQIAKKKWLDMDGPAGTLFYIFLGIFMAFGINIILGQALATDMPVVAVESNSMVPTFYQGDILIIQGARSAADYSKMLSVGDIIVFSVEGRSVPIVHRIKQINPDGTFQTQGDANTAQHPFEKQIFPSQIHGKTVAIVPYLGWVKIGTTEYILPFITKNIIFVVLIAATVTFLYLMVKEYR